MAITTLDGLVAGLLPSQDVYRNNLTVEGAGFLASSWLIGGMPGAATAPATGINGALLSSPVAGQVTIPATVAGKNIYLARWAGMQASGTAGVTLADRIWHNSGIALATLTAQAISQPTLDRDNVFDGSFTGHGVQAAIEVNATTLNNAGAITNTTISYTNELGTAGRTGTIASFPATGQSNTFVPFALAAGDYGIRSIQSITLGTSYGTVGSISLVMYRQIASMGLINSNTYYERGPVDLGLPRIHDSSVPFFIYTCTATSIGFTDFDIAWAQG